MLESWVLSKLDPLRPAPLVILRDPQRMIQPGAYAVHGWGEANGYAVFFCTGNMGLREMAERVRDDAEAHVLLVDRSRTDGRYPLFYPDLAAAAGPRRQITLSLREFLVAQTGDGAWPPLVEERNLARLILANLPGVLRAHGELRAVGGGRFSDSDLYRIVLGAALGINPFRQLSPAEVRRVCVQQHDAIVDLGRILPDEVLAALRRTIASAPAPFSSLFDRDPETILRAFTLAAIMRQHGLDHRLLLANLDPALHEYRDIATETLDAALVDQLTADPEQVMADVRGVEAFLVERPERLAFLLHEHLRLDDPEAALAVLRREKLSPLIRGLALVALLLDLIGAKRLKAAAEVIAVLDAQAGDASVLALRRPPAWWEGLERAYRRAATLFGLTAKLVGHAKKLKVAAADGADGIDFAYFDRLWNEEGLNRLDYYASDLERMLRVGDILPAPRGAVVRAGCGLGCCQDGPAGERRGHRPGADADQHPLPEPAVGPLCTMDSPTRRAGHLHASVPPPPAADALGSPFGSQGGDPGVRRPADRRLGRAAAADLRGAIRGDRQPAGLRVDPHRDAAQPQGHRGRMPAGRIHIAARAGPVARLAQAAHGPRAAVPGRGRRRQYRLRHECTLRLRCAGVHRLQLHR